MSRGGGGGGGGHWAFGVATSVWCSDLDWPMWCRDVDLRSRHRLNRLKEVPGRDLAC